MLAVRSGAGIPGAIVARGQRVALRTVEKEDLSFLQRAYADPALRYPIGNPVKNRRQLDEWIADDDADRFLVCRQGDDAEPGQPAEDDVRRLEAVSVEGAEWRRPDLTYWLAPEIHGEGYGAEAVSLAIDYAFRTYDAPAIVATAYDFNEASRGLLESLGFTEEGRTRKYRYVDGEHRDGVRYGLLREEWED